ncbi:MAG: FecR family protein [Spirosomataceae bacterium]
MNTSVNKELLFNHFARKTSPLQRQLIEEWLKNPASEEYYYEWLEEWERYNLQYLPETETALEVYKNFMDSTVQEVTEETQLPILADKMPLRLDFKKYWMIAASVACLLGLMTFIFRNNIQYQYYTTGKQQQQSILLPDGSKAELSENSSLRVPRWGFGTLSREVLLVGEASFSVKHTSDHKRFIVKSSNQFEVVVLGTEFSVCVRNQGSKVVLKKGKVRIQYTEGNQAKQLIMKPGELVSLDMANHIQKKVVASPPSTSEITGNRFVFDETTLQEVGYLLEENYGLQVEIKGEELAQRVLMGSFRAENVDELLKTISELLNINVVRQGNLVILSAY